MTNNEKKAAFTTGSRVISDEKIQASVNDALKRKGIVGFILDILAEVKKRWDSFRTQVVARAARKNAGIDWFKVFCRFMQTIGDLACAYVSAICGVAVVHLFAAGAILAGLYFFFAMLVWAAVGLYNHFTWQEIVNTLKLVDAVNSL